MSIFDKVFGSKKANSIEIAYGKDRYDVDFTPGAIEDGTITVGELRSQCTYITKTPAQNIRLLYRGKNLTNDTVKLSAVGMKSGSKVLCIASESIQPPERAAGQASTKTQAKDGKPTMSRTPKEQLAALLDDIRVNLEPSVKSFVNSPPHESKEKKDLHDRLAELLLQKLFALDGIVCKDDAPQSDREELRKLRKEAVQYTQSLLDSVDAIIRQDNIAAEGQESVL